MRDVVNILGVNIDMVDMKSAKERALSFLDGEDTRIIITPNSEIIMSASNDDELMNFINSTDLVVPDGIGVVYGSRIIKKPLPERVAGYDLVCEMFKEMAKTGKSVYLFGSKPTVAEIAAKNIEEEYKGIKVVGVHDGYFDDDAPIIADINEKKPDFLLVCLGFPKQEKWMHKNKDNLNVKAMIGAGGSLDVFAKVVERAPKFYCDHGIEWLYRLIKQPQRFVRMLALPKFGLKVLFKGKRYKGDNK